MATAMWRRWTQWMAGLWSPGRWHRAADRNRTKLMGIYLDQANTSGRLRGETEFYQERSDGKFAQRRNRD